MHALVLDGKPILRDIPPPRPGPGEALVRVLSAGICKTDLELVQGYMGFKGTLGHEFVGIAEECANDNLRGKRVVGEINCVCHQCQFCLREMTHHCLNRTVLGIVNRDGAFAQYLTLPEENLHLVPPTIRDDIAVFAEPVAAAFRILEQVTILPEDRIVVLGDGRLGQLIAQVLWTRNKNVLVVGKHPQKLELLAGRHIPTVLVDQPVERGADIVVEATGSHEGFQRAMELVRPEGTIVLKTTITHPTAFDMSVPVVNEVNIVGSRCGPFRPALEALASGEVEVWPMVTDTFELTDAELALRRAADPDTIKVILHM